MANPNNFRSLSEEMDEADRLINTLNSSPFSDKAYQSLKEKISQYIGSIIVESIKISKRQKADLVSKTHIEQASDNLISKRRGKLKYLAGTIGGILLGTTVSNVFGMMVLGTVFSNTGIVVTIVIGVIGAFLISPSVGGD